MLARHALPWVYRRFTRGMELDDKLEFDALLGDAAADAVLQERRREAIANMGAVLG